MKLVIDANIAFSYFNKNSFTRTLLEKELFELFAPELLLLEIKKYQLDIQKKCRLSNKEFLHELYQLKKIIQFVLVHQYKYSLQQAKKFSPDPADIDYLGLAHYLHCALWSQDKRLQEQERVLVLRTIDIAEIVSQD